MLAAKLAAVVASANDWNKT